GQSLKSDPFASQPEPTRQPFVFWKQLEKCLVNHFDIRSFTRKGRPAKRPAPQTELRTDIRGHETWKVERASKARLLSPLPQVIAIVEGDRSSIHQADHLLDVRRHGARTERGVALGIRR